MGGYAPLKITGNATGLVQNREEFLLPNDAYPTLQNAYVWRERILRKQGYQLLGRLQRTIQLNFNLIGGARNIFNAAGLEPTATLVPKTLTVIGGNDGSTYTDPNGNGVLVRAGGSGTGGVINYVTGVIRIESGGIENITGVIDYYPGLPVMGIRTEELQNSGVDRTIFFDQEYAYIYNTGSSKFQEFIPGTTWNADGQLVTATNFFWSTNYWVSAPVIPGTGIDFFESANIKLFWVTNNSGALNFPDPIRITDGNTWVDFVPPNFGQIDAVNFLVQCLSFLPFRGRMVAFNTYEGPTLRAATNFSNRIRWSTIGNPFIIYSNGPPATGSWRDDVRGQGGFLDIPTSEDIISVGYVRDNIVIYCERSTWQLRYTGRSISPFQIERVNSELGGSGPFSAIQFDTSLVGIGDKGIVQCDSYRSDRIDIKIPDFVFKFLGVNNAPFRVHGIRDFVNRLAFWTVPLDAQWTAPGGNPVSPVFPTQRLVYNYENDSWALFNDSLTCFGNYQPQSSRTWLNTHLPWVQCNFPWRDNRPAAAPIIVAGNQQGFIEQLDQLNTNDVSLYIDNIVSDNINPTIVTSPNHNMRPGFVIGISQIPDNTPFSNLNGGVYGIQVIDQNTFSLYLYDPVSDNFDIPQLTPDPSPKLYLGGGLINIRENFSIVSKKFNFMDDGQSIQMGYFDILMAATGLSNPGAISVFVYLDYNDNSNDSTYNASNILPKNVLAGSKPATSDTFFNSIIPTSPSTSNEIGGTKFWQRVFCPTRANFLTIQYALSNAQMAGPEQQLEVQIDAQILWLRKAGRLSQP